MREKIHLEGKLITMEEIEPKFFPCVVEWRNDPTLNRFLNQNFILTMEKEQSWYENIYLPDDTQGFLIGIDRESKKPFGTLGWTDLNLSTRRCILGRLVVAEMNEYPMQAFEMEFLLGEYLYQFTDEHFCHVVKENRRAIKFDKFTGFVENDGEIQYPEETRINGMELIEFKRSRDQFETARENFYKVVKEE